MGKLIGAVIFWGSLSFALADAEVSNQERGDVGGNSGHGVECIKGEKRTIELLDYFEAARKEPPIEIKLGSSFLPPITQAQVGTRRLRNYDSQREIVWNQDINSFFEKVELVKSGPPLELQDDVGKVDLPKNCKLVQIVIRRPVFHPSIKPYLLDYRIYSKLSLRDRAGLILHEVIYGDALKVGQTNSLNTREFNQILSSPSFTSLNQTEYQELVARIFKPVVKVEFKKSVIEEVVDVGESVNLILTDYLKNPPSEAVNWNFVPDLVEWLEFDSQEETLTGMALADDIGDWEFSIVASNSDGDAIARIKIKVH